MQCAVCWMETGGILMSNNVPLVFSYGGSQTVLSTWLKTLSVELHHAHFLDWCSRHWDFKNCKVWMKCYKQVIVAKYVCLIYNFFHKHVQYMSYKYLFIEHDTSVFRLVSYIMYISCIIVWFIMYLLFFAKMHALVLVILTILELL